MKLTQFGTFKALTDNIGPHKQPLPLLTVKELRSHGTNFAIGAAVDDLGNMTGDVTMVDGKAYLSTQAEHARLMQDFEKVGFVQFANLPPEGTQHKKIRARTADDLIAQCKELIPENSQHAFMLRVRGNFNTIDWRGMNTVHGAYDSVQDMVERSPVTHGFIENFTLSGFYQDSKAAPKGIGAEGWHFHGVSDDRLKSNGEDSHQARGGHITGFTGFVGEVDVMPVHEWHIGTTKAVANPALPDTVVKTDQLYCFPTPAPEAITER